jgi:hypothetical protein
LQEKNARWDQRRIIKRPAKSDASPSAKQEGAATLNGCQWRSWLLVPVYDVQFKATPEPPFEHWLLLHVHHRFALLSRSGMHLRVFILFFCRRASSIFISPHPPFLTPHQFMKILFYLFWCL